MTIQGHTTWADKLVDREASTLAIPLETSSEAIISFMELELSPAPPETRTNTAEIPCWSTNRFGPASRAWIISTSTSRQAVPQKELEFIYLPYLPITMVRFERILRA